MIFSKARSVLDCASPLALWSGGAKCGLTAGIGKDTLKMK
jgi:hypothetical protein